MKIEKISEELDTEVGIANQVAEICKGRLTSTIGQIKNGTFVFEFPLMPVHQYAYYSKSGAIRYINKQTNYIGPLRNSGDVVSHIRNRPIKRHSFGEAMGYLIRRFNIVDPDAQKNIKSLKHAMHTRSNNYFSSFSNDEQKLYKKGLRLNREYK